MVEEEKEEKKEKKGIGILVPILTKIIVGVVVLIVVIGISYKVATVVKEKRIKEIAKIEELEAGEEKREPLDFEELGEFTGPLGEEGRFYKATVRLGFNGKKYRHLGPELAQRKWELRDLIDTIMRGKTSIIQTKEGKETLKEELKIAINDILIDGRIEEVFIDGLVIQ